MEVELEVITKQDLEFARRLRNRNRKYFLDSNYITKEAHAKWFKNLDYWFWIIWLNGKRIGTIGQKNNEIHNVIIDEKYRGRGILKEVLKQFDKDLPLEVLITNKNAINAYKKLGFKTISLRMKR